MSAPIIWFTGIKGVTFLIILLSSCFAFSLFKKNKRVFLFAVLLLLILFGSWAFSNFAQGEKKEGVNIALIQGNINKGSVWRFNNVDAVFSIYENLTFEALKGNNISLIVWPEGTLVADTSKRTDLIGRLKNISEKNNLSIVVGGVTFLDDIVKGYLKDTRIKNTVFFVTPTEDIKKYYSINPYPFDKRTIAGEELANFSVNNKKFGVMTCYEEILPAISAAYAKKDSEFLISASNHYFVHERVLFASSLPPRARAAENYKYFATSTQTGITQVINPFGKVVASLEPEKEGFLSFTVYPNNKKTFYAAHGDLILNILSAIFLIYLFSALINLSIKKR
jgi:apolipoprotein N-acyltransferase